MSTLSHSDGTPVSEHLRRLLADVAAHPRCWGRVAQCDDMLAAMDRLEAGQ